MPLYEIGSRGRLQSHNIVLLPRTGWSVDLLGRWCQGLERRPSARVSTGLECCHIIELVWYVESCKPEENPSFLEILYCTMIEMIQGRAFRPSETWRRVAPNKTGARRRFAVTCQDRAGSWDLSPAAKKFQAPMNLVEKRAYQSEQLQLLHTFNYTS